MPSVEASRMPTLVRAAATSRATAAAMSSPGARVVPGPLPLADVLEHGAVRLVPGVHRRAPHRVEQRAAVAPDDRAEGHRRIGRAEGRDADLGDRSGRSIAATMPSALTLLVLPWSVPMPVVV